MATSEGTEYDKHFFIGLMVFLAACILWYIANPPEPSTQREQDRADQLDDGDPAWCSNDWRLC